MATRRYSKQRELIYQNVKSRTDHPTAEMVYQDLKPCSPALSLGTVYRNLNLLTEEGTLLRLPMEVDRYDANVATHGHLECRCCGNVLDLEGDAARVCDLFADENSDYCLEGCVVIFRGVCPDCRRLMAKEA